MSTRRRFIASLLAIPFAAKAAAKDNSKPRKRIGTRYIGPCNFSAGELNPEFIDTYEARWEQLYHQAQLNIHER